MNAKTGFINKLETEKIKLDFYSAGEKARLKYIEKVKNIVDYKGKELIDSLWDKTITFENLGQNQNLVHFNSELHLELSKKYPVEYSEALIVSGMKNIGLLATFGGVLRNLLEYLNNDVNEKQYMDTIYTIFSLIPDLTKIPLIDLDIFRKNLGDNNLLSIISNRKLIEKNYVIENLMKYKS